MSRCKECLIQRQPQPVSQPSPSRTVKIGSILSDWHRPSLMFRSAGLKVESHTEFKISPGVHSKLRSIFRWFREEISHRIKIVWQFFKWENEHDIQTWLKYTSLFSTIVGHKSTFNFLLVFSVTVLSLLLPMFECTLSLGNLALPPSLSQATDCFNLTAKLLGQIFTSIMRISQKHVCIHCVFPTFISFYSLSLFPVPFGPSISSGKLHLIIVQFLCSGLSAVKWAEK